jgi:hypothetical protein
LSQVVDFVQRETGFEPAKNRRWGAPLATDGDENWLEGEIFLKSRQTMEVDDVWQYEAIREYGPERVGTDE